MENVSFCTFPQKPDAVSQKQDLHIKLAPYVTAIVSLISVGATCYNLKTLHYKMTLGSEVTGH